MPIKLKITDLEDNSSIYMYLRKRSVRSGSDIGRNINNQGPKDNGVSTCNYGDDGRSNFWFWYEYDVAPRDNPAMPYNNNECGKEVYNYGDYGGGNACITSYNYGRNVTEKEPYYDVGVNNQISPYNYECGKEVYNYGGGNAGITSYNYGRNVPDKGPYYDVGVSAYNCGKEAYNYGGVTSYNYGGKVPDKGPYYDVGVNNQISPYQYGNKGVASCNYQCTAQISPNCYSGGIKGVPPSPYQGEVDMKKSPMKCPPRDIPRITSPINCPPRDNPRIMSPMNCPPRDIPRIMSPMNCPPRDIPRIMSPMNCPPRDIPRIMSPMNCPPRDIPRITSPMNCPPRDIPRITSPMNCPPRDIPRITSPMNCPPRDIPRIMSPMNCPPNNIPRITSPMNCPPRDIPRITSPMNCPPRDIPRIMSPMNCPPNDIPRITSPMNCPPRDIPRITSPMNCPPRDIPRIMSPMNCPPRDIPRIMSPMNCPPRDIPRITSPMNCPPRDIPRITSLMNCPPRDIPRITSPMNCPPRDIPRITRLKCKRKCCKKLKTQGKDIKITPMSAEGLSKVGLIAKKYLSKNSDFIFGIHFDKEANAFKVGRDLVMVDGNDMVLSFEEEVMRYTGTEGLWRLITQDMSYFDEDYYFSDEDWVVYMELLLRTNYHQCSDTVAKDDDPENITPMFLCCLGLGAGGVAVGGAGGLAVGGAGGLAIGGAGGLVVGGAVGGTVGFVGGVGFTLATLLGLKFAANLGKVLTSALYTVLSKKANFIAGALGGMAQAGVNIYGKIGQLKDGIYDALKNLAPKPISWGTYLKDKMSHLFWGAVGKIVPISPGGGPDLSYLKFWEWFKCPTCILFKELDELLRLLISLQKPETSPNKQCGFNQNCLLFWILERIVACFGKEGGCEKLIDWLKINVPLIISSDLLKQLIENLPWGYQQKTNPICGPQTKPAQQDKDCSNQGQRYRWYLDLDIKLEAEVRVGVEVMDVLFKKDPQFFEKIEGSINLPCKELNEALKSLLEFLKNYFQIESQDGCLI